METPVSRLNYDAVTVDFGATRALHDVSFDVAPGEILGLLGHNGAGKSTLFNVTTGVIGATSGSFSVDGTHVTGALSPHDAAKLGITVVHQEPALAPNMTVLDNLYLARTEPRGHEKVARAKEALLRVGASVQLDIPVSALSLGERQLVDLARGLLAGDMKVLLLDEPTAALGKAETESLHALITSFAAQGVAVLYVSHRLPDILEVCTRIVVLRGGSVVLDDHASQFTPEKLASALVPDLRSLDFTHTAPGEETLSITHSKVELTACAGEVVGLFGMAGGPQFSLLASIAGATPHVTPYRLQGSEVRFKSPAQAISRGVFYVPPDRDTEGLIAGESALNNVMLPWYGLTKSRGWWVPSNFGRSIYAKARSELDIRGPQGDAAVSQFSGGNRQKHLLARWLYPKPPTLLLLAQPTQGVDVGAKVDIVEAARFAAQQGATVVVASSESDEIASICDRAYTVVTDGARPVPRSTHYNEELLASLLSLAESAHNRKPQL